MSNKTYSVRVIFYGTYLLMTKIWTSLQTGFSFQAFSLSPSSVQILVISPWWEPITTLQGSLTPCIVKFFSCDNLLLFFPVRNPPHCVCDGAGCPLSLSQPSPHFSARLHFPHLGLPDLNKNTRCSVKFEFQINKDYLLCISMFHAVFGIYLYSKRG